MRKVLAIGLAAALLGGCGGSGSSTETGAAQGVELTYHRSGGFAPIDETLRIHRSGSASLIVRLPPQGDVRKAELSRFELGAAQAQGLAGALKRSGFEGLEPTPTNSGCADCFVYELATPANALRFDQATIPRALRPVLARLDAIVAAHRPGG